MQTEGGMSLHGRKAVQLLQAGRFGHRLFRPGQARPFFATGSVFITLGYFTNSILIQVPLNMAMLEGGHS